jgi:hypothetical protein
MSGDYSRRSFLGASASGAALVFAPPAHAPTQSAENRERDHPSNLTSVVVNGQHHPVAVDPRVTGDLGIYERQSCRCVAYPNTVAAIRQASVEMRRA